MIPVYNHRFIIFISTLLVLVSCTKTPEEKFAHAVEKFNEKQDPEARLLIEEAFLKDWGAVKLEEDKEYVPGQNAIILKEGEISTIITSDGYREPWTRDIRFANYTASKSELCISDGYSADFFTFSTDEEDGTTHISRLKEIYLTEDDKTSIDSLDINQNVLFYYYKRGLHSIDLATEEKKLISRSKGKEIALNPPYDKFSFKVFMYVEGSYIGCCVGDAGLYNLYVFDSQRSSLVFKKKVPSRFFYIKQESVYCFTGKSGEWKLSEYRLSSEGEKEIKTFTSLKDISISENKVFYIDNDGSHIVDSSFTLEFSEDPGAKIERIANDYLIINYRKTKYLVSTKLYFSIIDKYKSLAPDFFNTNKDLTAGDLEK